MLLVYPKAAKDNIPGHILREVRKEIEVDRTQDNGVRAYGR